MFQHVPAYPGDPILSLMEDFQADTRPNKVSLSIGIYFDDDGKLPVMSSVRKAETALLQNIGPLVEYQNNEKPLSIAFREIDEGLLEETLGEDDANEGN